MADRYWVGGTGTWDATVGTKWAATSGGAGGQTVPTSADNVFFDANSGAVTVTVSGNRVCLTLNATAFTGTITGTSTPSLTIYGSLLLGSGMTFDSTSGPDITFFGSAGAAINTGGKVLRGITIQKTFYLQLQSAVTCNSSTFLVQGTLQLLNYTFTTPALFSNYTNTRGIDFGSGSNSKIVFTGSGAVFGLTTTTGFTLSGTSSRTLEFALQANQSLNAVSNTTLYQYDIVVPSTAGNFTFSLNISSQLTYYRSLRFENATYTVAWAPSNNIVQLSGNLFIGGPNVSFTGLGTGGLRFGTNISASITTNGNITPFILSIGISGNASSGTITLADSLTNTATVTLNAGTLALSSYTLTMSNFSSSNTTTRSISFGTGKIVMSQAPSTGTYWNTTTATNLTLTGSKAIEFVPPNSGITATYSVGTGFNDTNAPNGTIVSGGTGTISPFGSYVNFTAKDFGYTVAATTIGVAGNLLIEGTNPIFNSGGTFSFFGTGSGTNTINTGGETTTWNLNFVQAITKTYRFDSDYISAAGNTTTLTLTTGIVSLQSYTVNINNFSSNNTNTRSINFGTGKIVINNNNIASNTIWNMTSSSLFTSSGSRLVEVFAPTVPATKDMVMGTNVAEANTLNVSVVASGTGGQLRIQGRVNNLSFINTAYTLGFGPSVYGNIFFSGTGPSVTGFSLQTIASSGTKTITTNGVTLGILTISNSISASTQLIDALTTVSNLSLDQGILDLQSYTLTAATFQSSNSNVRSVNFGTGKIVLTSTLTAGVVGMYTSTNFTSSGTRLIEALTGGSGGRTLAFGTGVTEANTLNLSIVLGASPGGGSFLVTGRINNFNASASAVMAVNFDPVVYGDFFFDSSVLFNAGGTSTTTFAATSGTKSITTSGVTMQCGVDFNGVGGTWQLQSALTVGTAHRMTLTAGAVDLNDYSCSVGSYTLASNSNVKSIDFGTSEIFITDSLGYSINANTALNIPSAGYTNYSVAGLNRFALSPGASDILIFSAGNFENLVPSLRVVSATTILVSSLTIKDLILSGSGDIRPSTQSSNVIEVYGNLLAEATWTGQFGATGDPSFNPPFYYNKLTFVSTTGVKTITSNGKTINAIIQFSSATGSWRFEDAYTQSVQSDPSSFVRYMYLDTGTIDLNGYTVAVNSFRKLTGTATLTFNGGRLSILADDVAYPSPGADYGPCYIDFNNLTLNRDTGIISFDTTGATTFWGGGAGAYLNVVAPKIRANLSSNGLRIRVLSTRLTIEDLLPIASGNSYFFFDNGSTYYFENFTLTPSGSNRAFLQSTSPSSPYYFVLNIGVASGDNLNIQDSNATPATATWFAGANSVDAGGNTGWIFGTPGVVSSNMFLLLM
jgi:hypothetical protein